LQTVAADYGIVAHHTQQQRPQHHLRIGQGITGTCITGSCITGTCITGTCITGTCITGTCITGTCITGTCITGTCRMAAATAAACCRQHCKNVPAEAEDSHQSDNNDKSDKIVAYHAGITGGAPSPPPPHL
jgi:hypothetical protein